MAASTNTSDKLIFYTTDTCPYAQRSWIALLEKEAIPAHPQLFELKWANLYDKSPITNPEFIGVNPLGLVPSAFHKGAKLNESLILNEYIDEALNPARPLLPGAPTARWAVRAFIDKHSSLTNQLFPLLTSFTDDEKKTAIGKTLDALKIFSSAIVGPYAIGEQFTLADIAYIPHIERLITLGAHYAGLTIPSTPEYAKFNAWWAAVSGRESVKITRADRTPESLARYAGEAKSRDAYLIETFEPIHYGLFGQMKAALAAGKWTPGKKLFTTEELVKLRSEEQAKKVLAK